MPLRELAQTLLQRCPDLQVPATSRERLHVAGEAVWPVPGMTVPALQDAQDRFYLPRALNGLAQLAVHRGAPPAAMAPCREALDILRETGEPVGSGVVRCTLAHALVDTGDLGAAREAFGAALEACRAALGDAAFDAAYAEGLALTMDQAIAYALEPATA